MVCLPTEQARHGGQNFSLSGSIAISGVFYHEIFRENKPSCYKKMRASARIQANRKSAS
jgi:hypothetical protein